MTILLSNSFFYNRIIHDSQLYYENQDNTTVLAVRVRTDSEFPGISAVIRKLFDELATRPLDAIIDFYDRTITANYNPTILASNLFALHRLIYRPSEQPTSNSKRQCLESPNEKRDGELVRELIDRFSMLPGRVRDLLYRDYLDVVPPDIQFVLGTTTFGAHKSILGYYTYWDRLFNSPTQDGSTQTISVPDANPETFLMMLEWLYSRLIPFIKFPTQSMEQLEAHLVEYELPRAIDLRNLASKYQLQLLMEEVASCIHVRYEILSTCNYNILKNLPFERILITDPLYRQRTDNGLWGYIVPPSFNSPQHGELGVNHFYEELEVEGHKIKANTVLLKVRSLFFQRLLSPETVPYNRDDWERPHFSQLTLQLMANQVQEGVALEKAGAFQQDSHAFEFLELLHAPAIFLVNLWREPAFQASIDLPPLVDYFKAASQTLSPRWLYDLMSSFGGMGVEIFIDQILPYFGPFMVEIDLPFDRKLYCTNPSAVLRSIADHCPNLKRIRIISGPKKSSKVIIPFSLLRRLETFKVEGKIRFEPPAPEEDPLSLKNLLFYGNCITEGENQTAFFQVLKKAPHLQTLTLFHLKETQMKALLAESISLDNIIDLSPEEIDNPDPVDCSDETFLELARAFPKLTNASFLHCDKISEETIQAFIISHGSNLVSLDFDLQGISDATLSLIGNHCSQLQKLFLAEAIVSDEAVLALKQQLPTLHVQRSEPEDF